MQERINQGLFNVHITFVIHLDICPNQSIKFRQDPRTFVRGCLWNEKRHLATTPSQFLKDLGETFIGYLSFESYTYLVW